MLTESDAIACLGSYWAAQGAAVMQPYNTEVGAGTLNPATFLRVLGPEPWRVAYAEPSVRPDDSRYGDNPNRLQTHTQYQVILKPEPGNPQELYLGSLAALGIDLDDHDVRFVEDNWASPALGAWGLGWEVWLDGLEITQFTYFQQAGGFSLDPVSVEITYGMERIVMALQGVDHFKDIVYGPGLSYGDAFGQGEYEWSRYYLDDADVGAVNGLFETYEREARRLIDLRLPVPAYSYLLKCSHTFNIVDARGAISPTERARSFARMRQLAHQVAELWVERRAEEGFPLGQAATAPAGSGLAPTPRPAAGQPETAPGTAAAPGGDGVATLVFEIGTEELPAADVAGTAAQVGARLAALLGATRLAHGEIDAHASPRRVVVTVAGVAPGEQDQDERVRGPRISVAFDAGGRATAAAEGFARAHGVGTTELVTWEAGGVGYVGLERRRRGRRASEILAEILSAVVRDLRSPDRNMRWSGPGLSFARPIRWIVAVLGDEVVPFTVSNLTSGRVTTLARAGAHGQRAIASASGYRSLLAGAGIVVDGGARRELVRSQARALAGGVGGVADLDGALVDEVADLVERPHAILGRFDAGYLDLPADVLTTVMARHQRYFPVRTPAGELLAWFVAVADGDCDAEVVRAGNEAVLRARYADARFFWSADLSRSPDDLRAALDRLRFADRLGSMGDRAGRIGRLALELYDALPIAVIGPDEGVSWKVLERAAALVKFDLASQMVTELTSLAGVMAREYAREAGEPPAVAEALYQLELPRHSSDTLPAGLPGALLSVANRADLLAGLFAAGAEPTGSSDPFGLRRGALGLLAVLASHPDLRALPVDLVLDAAGSLQPLEWTKGSRDRALDFVARRWETQQVDAGRPAAAVRAVLPRFSMPAQAGADLDWLVDHRGDPAFVEVAQALGRASRIVEAGTEAGWDRCRAAGPAEVALRQALHAFAPPANAPGGPVPLASFVAGAGALAGAINRFFDETLVMDPDPEVRRNRLGLLAAVADRARAVLDWSALT